MKNLITLLFVTMLVVKLTLLQAQINLIPNPGFEDAQPGKTPQCFNGNNALIDADILWWKMADCSGSNGCHNIKSLPDWHGAGFSCTTNPFSLSRHIYLEEAEGDLQDAIRVGLFSTMNPTKNYIFKISYASGKRKSNGKPKETFPRVTIHLTKYSEHWSSSWGNVRAKFSMFPPFQVSPLPNPFDNANQNDWQQHWKIINSSTLNINNNKFDDLKNIVLDCSGNHAYIDYVELSENCADPLLIENHQFYNTINEIPYKSAGVLKAGFDVGNPLQNGNVVVNSGANATFKAANQIILEPGFVAETGSNFQTIIEPCDVNTAREDNTIIVIDDKTIQIGDFTIFDDRIETIGCQDTLTIYGLDGDTTSFLSYWWDFGNSQTSTNPVGTVFYNEPGEYLVKLGLTDSTGVTDTLSKIYIVPSCDRKSPTTKTINPITNKILPTLYPNPTTGSLTIAQLDPFAGGKLEIVNLMGQVVFSQPINATTLTVSLAQQPKGIYLVKISSNKENVVQKVVVE